MGTIDMRLARTDRERLDVVAVRYEATEMTQPWLLYAARRLESPLRRQARWWILYEDDQPQSALLCYDLELSRGAEACGVPAIGLGSVATRIKAQHRGFASRLCAHVIAEAEARGRALGLLFSAIPPQLYCNLGFRVHPAWDFACNDLAGFAASGPQARLIPLDPRDHMADLHALYRAHLRAQDAWFIDRRADTWETHLMTSPDTDFFGVRDDFGALVAFARTILDDNELEVLELIGAPDTTLAILRTLASVTAQLDGRDLCGWMRPEQIDPAWFDDRGRATCLPMMRGADDTPPRSAFFGSDHF